MLQSKPKQVNYQDSFEDLYLKHDYLKRIGEFDEKEMAQYEPIVKYTAKLVSNKFKVNFHKVGFYYDDIVNISRVYLYAYLGLYSFKVNPDKYEKFKLGFANQKGREPSDEEMAIAERNNIINFIRQKLSTCSTFCERKSRNIVVGRNEKKTFAFTADSIPASNDLILENHKMFGYRSVPLKEFTLIKKIGKKAEAYVDSKGFKVFEVELLSQIPVSFSILRTDGNDIEQSMDDFLHDFSTPSVENEILEMEEEIDLDVNMINFELLETSKRKMMLNTFIRNNENNKHLKEELYTARKMLKSM